MSARRKHRKPTEAEVWKEALFLLLKRFGPTYVPPEYGYKQALFAKEVARGIANMFVGERIDETVLWRSNSD